MLIDILNKINSINENLFSGFDALMEGLGMPEWLADAIIDSFHILPLLFIVFFIIELIEYFYADKINSFMKKSEKAAPVMRFFCNCKYSVYSKVHNKGNINCDLPCHIR